MRMQISLDGKFGDFAVAMEIPELFYECFDPIASGDEPLLSVSNSDVHKAEEYVKTKIKVRDDAAKIISKEVSAFLVDCMKCKDTHNGYNKE